MRLLICLIIGLSAMSCGNNVTGFKDSDTLRQKEKRYLSPRSITEIPENLKLQRYVDALGKEVSYDHKAQLEQLFQLEKEGKKLHLIIGRGNAEIPQKKPLGDKENIWVYGQKDGRALVKDATPHLFMDFDKEEHLKTIPDELFSTIAFDYSVVKFFHDISNSAREFYRMLRPGGQFFADLMVGSAALAMPGRIALEDRCPDIEGGKIYQTKSGIRYCLGHWEANLWQDRFVDGVFKRLSDEDNKEMNSKRIELIKNYLEELFGKNSCQLKSSGAPVPENENQFLECTKKK